MRVKLPAQVPFVLGDAESRSLHFSIYQLQSRMLVGEPYELTVDYTRTMMGFLLLNRHPTHIAKIGLGGGSLAKFCRHSLPESNFMAIEVNPHVIALRDEFLIPEEGDHFRVIEADGADFIQGTIGTIDVLLIDGFDYQGQPPQLSSQKFYADCKRALAPTGVMVINFHEIHGRRG
jgi:spermidine synthase